MSIIAFVPIRSGSKSIPFKNVKLFCGRPLVYWVLKSLEESSKVDKVIVAVDSEMFHDIILSFNFSKVEVYERSRENATDTSSTESVLLEYLHKALLYDDDLIVLCQATSPFTQAKDIDSAVGQLIKENAQSLLSCCRIKRFIWDEDGRPYNYDYKNRPRRQEYKGSLVENGAFYINSVFNIVKNKNRLSGKISIFEMPDYTYTELDEPEDWAVAEGLMKKYILKAPIREIKLLLLDIDGVLTDAGMYYSENGDELKKFSTYDGMAIKLFRQRGIKVGLITSEDRILNKVRAEKMKVDYLYQGVGDKYLEAKEICKMENLFLHQVAYIGDDINDKVLLENVGFPACPENAQREIKDIPGILKLNKCGGEGVVREFYEYIFQ